MYLRERKCSDVAFMFRSGENLQVKGKLKKFAAAAVVDDASCMFTALPFAAEGESFNENV